MPDKLKVEVIPLSQVPPSRTRLNGQAPLVLVVDDEQIIADTLSIILSKSGFNTMTAYDAATALELARNTPPDLLISDVVMPAMSGIELAIALTKLYSCKVLLFSGQAATVDLLDEARHLGHDFTTLTKPVHPTDMLKRISEALTPHETNAKPLPSPKEQPQTQAQLVT